MRNLAEELPFASVGKNVMIWPQAQIIGPEVIAIGDSVMINDFVFLMGGKATSIGSFVHIAPFSLISGSGELLMEDFTCLSGGVRLYTGNEDYSGQCMTNSAVPAPYRQPIRSFVHIRKHAIVGANSVILPGVTIGEGAVVGANSLVKHSCEPWTVYVGSPARPLKTRPHQRILELEAQLRQEFYDAGGNYIARS